jgi:phosphate:Na+ symporter
MHEGLDFLKIGMELTAGLVLFLFGVSRLAVGLKEAASERAKALLGKITRNRFAGVLTGATATALLDSSSVVIIMVIAMVDAGLLGFVESLGVIMGSNIGTTFGAEIIALQVDEYAPLALAAGGLLLAFGRGPGWKRAGTIIFGVGLLFFGLGVIDGAMAPFKDYPPFLQWMRTLGDKPLLGALVGMMVTLTIQSSSATMAIVITLASQGLISLPAGVAIMLGAELGTVSDTLIAAIGRSRQAVRAGLFHFFFNLVTGALGVLLISRFVALVQWISGDAAVGRQIAHAQVLFNVLGVLLFIGFVPLIARALTALLPDRREAKAPVGFPEERSA